MRFLEIGKHKHNESYSIGIIGGADGPAAVYCSDSVTRWLRKWLARLAAAAAAVAAVGGLLLFWHRKNGN